MSVDSVWAPSPDRSIRIEHVGEEHTPVMIIDQLVEQPERLRAEASHLNFTTQSRFFPGIRAPVSLSYQRFVLESLQEAIADAFGLSGRTLKFTMCQYSLVTTPPERLSLLQRIPHFDSLEPEGLAAIHYLFRSGYGGTAFYRHRKTGFERLTEARKVAYLRSLESENDGPNMPGRAYINGSTPLFEEIGRVEGVFNRMVVYPRNILHSGCIEADFHPDPDPLTGRLSINSFIDVVDLIP